MGEIGADAGANLRRCKDWQRCTFNRAHEAVYKDNHLADCR